MLCPTMLRSALVLLALPRSRSQSPGYPSSGTPQYCTAWCAGAVGDPHLRFANGGTADFRGSHRASYAFVSSPGYQFAPYFQAIDFMYKSAVGLHQLIHGTFMTQATWHLRTSTGRHIVVKADAMRPGEVDIAVLRSEAAHEANLAALLGGEEHSLLPWDEMRFDDVKVSTRFLTVAVETAAWAVEVTAKPIYGLVPPLLNNTHIHGRWQEDQRRLDISIRGAFPQPDAHGVVGQSFRDATRRDGALDDYDINSAPDRANSDGFLPALTTSAQAEGAIDGVYTDYKLGSVLSTAFAYSRFERTTRPFVGTPSQRTASTSEWDGLAGSEALKRQRPVAPVERMDPVERLEPVHPAVPDEARPDEARGRGLSECVCPPAAPPPGAPPPPVGFLVSFDAAAPAARSYTSCRPSGSATSFTYASGGCTANTQTLATTAGDLVAVRATASLRENGNHADFLGVSGWVGGVLVCIGSIYNTGRLGQTDPREASCEGFGVAASTSTQVDMFIMISGSGEVHVGKTSSSNEFTSVNHGARFVTSVLRGPFTSAAALLASRTVSGTPNVPSAGSVPSSFTTSAVASSSSAGTLAFVHQDAITPFQTSSISSSTITATGGTQVFSRSVSTAVGELLEVIARVSMTEVGDTLNTMAVAVFVDGTQVGAGSILNSADSGANSDPASVSAWGYFIATSTTSVVQMRIYGAAGNIAVGYAPAHGTYNQFRNYPHAGELVVRKYAGSWTSSGTGLATGSTISGQQGEGTSAVLSGAAGAGAGSLVRVHKRALLSNTFSGANGDPPTSSNGALLFSVPLTTSSTGRIEARAKVSLAEQTDHSSALLISLWADSTMLGVASLYNDLHPGDAHQVSVLGFYDVPSSSTSVTIQARAHSVGSGGIFIGRAASHNEFSSTAHAAELLINEFAA